MRALLAGLALVAASLAAAPAASGATGCELGRTIECQSYTSACNVDASTTPSYRSASADANCGHGMYRCYVSGDVRSALLEPGVDHGCAV